MFNGLIKAIQKIRENGYKSLCEAKYIAKFKTTQRRLIIKRITFKHIKEN